MSVVLLCDRMSHKFYCQACRSTCDERYVCNATRRKHNDYVIWRTHKYVSIKPKKKSFLLKISHNVLSRTHTTQAVQPYRLYMYVISLARKQINSSFVVYSTLSNALSLAPRIGWWYFLFCSAYLFLFCYRFFLYYSVLFGISNNQCFGAHETTSNDTVTRTVASIMATTNTQCQNGTNTLWWTLVHSRKTPLTYACTRTRTRRQWQRAREQAKFTICTRNLLPRFHFISERWFNVQRRTLDIEEECVVYRLELNCVGYLFCFFHPSPLLPPLPSPSVHSVHQQFSSMTNNLKTPTTSATTMTAPWIG